MQARYWNDRADVIQNEPAALPVVDGPETGVFTVPDAGDDDEGAAGTDFASVFILATAVARNLSSIAITKLEMPPVVNYPNFLN
jgi:hypothetical protein